MNTTKLLISFRDAVIILLLIFILGLFIPMLISSFVVVLTNASFADILTTSSLFWVATVFGWFISAVWVNDELKQC